MHISIQDNSVVLQADKQFQPLYLLNPNSGVETCFHFSEQEGLYRLSVSEVQATFTGAQEERAEIVDGSRENIMDLVPDFTFDKKSSLVMTGEGGREFYIYPSLDHKLRIISGQKPSVRSYIHHVVASKVRSSQNGLLEIFIRYNNEYIDPIQARIKINARDTEYSCISATAVPMERDEHGGYFQFSIPITELMEHFGRNSFQPLRYDTLVYDLSAQFFMTAETTHPWLRIAGDEHVCKDVYSDIPESQCLVTHWYLTPYKNLSFRESVVPSETAEVARIAPSDGPQIVHQKPIILFTEYPERAQDNAFHLFKYFMLHCAKDFDAYYVLAPDSPDIRNVHEYREHVLVYRSPKHYQMFMAADLLAHAHTSSYALPFISYTAKKKLLSISKLFLQHGVVALKDISKVYSYSPSFTDAIIVSSDREASVVHHMLKFPDKRIFVTGLARFDTLLRSRNLLQSWATRKKILIMPTWRPGLDHLTEVEFKNTGFYSQLSDFINSSLWTSLGCSVDLYLHRNFQPYLHLFHSKNVNIISEGDFTVQSLLTSHGIMITDYSSAALDFALLKRPVVYYEFYQGKDLIETKLNDFLPGPVFTEESDVFDFIHRKRHLFVMDHKYVQRLRDIYQFGDRSACQRIVKVISSMKDIGALPK